jgi:Beta-lactamase
MQLRHGTPKEAGMLPARIERARDLCAQWIESGHTPAISVCVARRGVIVLHDAFGVLGPEPGAGAIDRRSLFPLSSVSKPIMATLVMQLVEDGRIGLNRPVLDYIPGIKAEHAEEMLVHHLLTHTSGYCWYDEEPFASHAQRKVMEGFTPSPCAPNQHPLHAAAIELFLDVPLARRPGEIMIYSNHNYELLSEIVRRVSGRPHWELAQERSYWILTLDSERAAVVAQIGIDVAKDPTLRAANGLYRTIGLLADTRFEEAGRVIDDWLPFLEENENYWQGQPTRGCRAAVDLASGQLSSGMRGGLDSARSLREAGFEASAVFTDVFNLLAYVSIARRDVTPAFGALLRNPWFVFTQAPFAARKARRMIDRLRAEAEQKDLRGFQGLIDLAEGRLLAHQGKKAQAREVLERIRRFLADAGVEHVQAPIAALAAEIEG